MSRSWTAGTFLHSPFWWTLKWKGISSLLHLSVKGRSLSGCSFMFTGDFFPGLNECIELDSAHKTRFWEGTGKRGGGESTSRWSAGKIQTPNMLASLCTRNKGILKPHFPWIGSKQTLVWSCPCISQNVHPILNWDFFLIPWFLCFSRMNSLFRKRDKLSGEN